MAKLLAYGLLKGYSKKDGETVKLWRQKWVPIDRFVNKDGQVDQCVLVGLAWRKLHL